MGWWKDYEIERDEITARGYIAPERGKRYLCPHHYKDAFLHDFIDRNGHDGRCTYCGKHTIVIDLADFVEHVGSKLAEWLEDIDNAGLFLEKSFYDNDSEKIPGYQRAGGYIAPDDAEYYETNDEVMDDFDLIADDDALNDDVSGCLFMERKIRRDPTTMELSKELSYKWEDFCRLVKGERRFTFFRSPMFEKADPSCSDNGLFDILTEIGTVIRAAEDIIPAGTVLYRCRPAKNTDSVKEFKNITAPPADKAKTNRLSPVGISMFYGSYDRETPYKEVTRYETKPSDCYYIGQFSTKCDLTVVDLTSLRCSFWMEDHWQETLFLKHFHGEITKVIHPDDEELEYVPSQIFTEYLRYLCTNKCGSHYDGILYRSSLTGERNVALFYDNQTSAQVLSLNNITQNRN